MDRLEIEAVVETWSQRTEPVEHPVVISWHGCEAGGKTAVQALRVFESHMRWHFPERELVIRLKNGAQGLIAKNSSGEPVCPDAGKQYGDVP